jgi:hypothetical protein
MVGLTRKNNVENKRGVVGKILPAAPSEGVPVGNCDVRRRPDGNPW